MAANYDMIAPIYDLTSCIVFGRTIAKAQICLLRFIPAGSRVLIAGGGTGWILEEITKLQSDGLEIDYVEASAKMMQLSQRRNYKSNVVNFIQSPIENYNTEKQYDVIITPFLFDNFKAHKLEIVFEKLHAQLKTDGLWLYADFVYDQEISPMWQKLLLRIMYLFFRITTGVETSELFSVTGYFAESYLQVYESYRYADFIRSAVYRKL